MVEQASSRFSTVSSSQRLFTRMKFSLQVPHCSVPLVSQNPDGNGGCYGEFRGNQAKIVPK